ncbi:DEAD/DEAH box helicase [Aliamphritea spongicola]|uniref:DEAD/DEAH box helicase n=1 Tax=Aliamphritea spongicola TaxID=707589 RepID=UPI00196B9A43|nr:DEAD/DEAH box helicase [Aliamphritea spongicola]MBN3563025.1 DEAD/DEAH box helicase [Aliamphritea spongicola]
MSFIDLDLDLEILGALADNDFLKPTDIQQQAIPAILDGLDLLASAPTGTGKTLAFVLPGLQHILDSEPDSSSAPQVLILSPTRELAKQTYEVIQQQTANSHINSCLIVGGVPFGMQKAMLAERIDIMVATPGRLLELNAQQWLDMSVVDMLVIDEADRMLDMGFIESIQQIADVLPQSRQTLMFSATLESDKIQKFASDLLNEDARCLEVEQPRHIPDHIKHSVYQADNEVHKDHLLKALVKSHKIDQAIVFVNSRKQVDHWVHVIRGLGITCAGLHGDLRQSDRGQRVKDMRRKRIKIMVATDVAGRGLDLPDIHHIINLQLPMKADSYVHRAGRSGRDGRNGYVWSIVDALDWPTLGRIERFIGQKIARATYPGLASKKPEPVEKKKQKAKAKTKTKAKSKVKGKAAKPKAKAGKKPKTGARPATPKTAESKKASGNKPAAKKAPRKPKAD